MKQKRSKKVSACLTSFAKFQDRHWVFTCIFIQLSAFWLPILYTFLGVQLGLVVVIDQSCCFTKLGIAIMAVFFVIVILGNIASIYNKKVNVENSELEELKAKLLEKTEDGYVLHDLNNSTYSICDSKLSTLKDWIDYFILHPEEEAPRIISDPMKQLDAICRELSLCLVGLLKFQSRRNISDLFTSIIFRFPESDDKGWHWATTERGLSISELFTEKDGQKSSLKHLIDDVKGHVFFENSKQTAYDEGYYIPDSEDEYDDNDRLKGSIACFRYTVQKHNKTIIEFVLTITSYSQQVIPDKTNNDEFVNNTKYNLEKVVLPDYIMRAKIELCLLYIKHLNDGTPLF